jgi:hypothetical protein
VTFYPFVMMDIAIDNGLPNPWNGAGAQPPYPWRGRITCDPAPGQSGSPQGSAGAAVQVASFLPAANGIIAAWCCITPTWCSRAAALTRS